MRSHARCFSKLLPKPAENHLITMSNRAGSFAARGRIRKAAHGPDWTGKYFFVRLGVYKAVRACYPAALLRRRAGRAYQDSYSLLFVL